MSFESVLKYPTVFLFALAVVWFLTPWVGRLAARLGAVDLPGQRRLHRGVIPRLGGLAVFVGFHIGCATVFLIPWKPFSGQITIADWHILLLTTSLMVLIGAWDDIKGLRPALKLLGQIAVAVLTVSLGVRMGSGDGGWLPGWMEFLVSVAWILLLVNAFNLIDGMDGLASGLALVSAVGLSAALFLRYHPGDALLFLALGGACLGFLRYNFHPASIFLGDSGSMLLGYLLATLSILTQSKGPALAVVSVPLFAMGIPLLDTLLAIWRRSVRRTASGDSSSGGLLSALASADDDHLHHRLVRSGLDQRRAALLLYGGAIVLGVVGLLLTAHRSPAQGILLIAGTGLFYVIFRHVAVSELRQSGWAVLQGLQRPTTRNSSVIGYVLVDAVVLFGALMLASGLAMHFVDTSRTWKEIVFRLLPSLWGIPMICLVLSRAYSRVWSLARVTEFIWVGIMLLAGIAIGVGQYALIGSDGASRLALLTALMHAGIVVPLVTASRALVRVVQDFLATTHTYARAGAADGRRVLLVGPSTQAAMVLRFLSLTPPPGFERAAVVGVLDDDPVFQRRWVHGVPVLGKSDAAVDQANRNGITDILLVGPVDPAREARLQADFPLGEVRLHRFSLALVDVTAEELTTVVKI